MRQRQRGSKWQVLDLCCGLGGISLAARQLGCHVVGGVDVSEPALESFRHNFPEAVAVNGSIGRRSTIAKCGELLRLAGGQRKTLIVSGPPCQGFSAAGPRSSRDPRNRVLMAVARAVVRLEPDAALVENVAALMSLKHRKDLSRFTEYLAEAGYCSLVLRLDAASYGVAQRRHRMICLISRTALNRQIIAAGLDKLRQPAVNVRAALAGLRRPPVYRGPRAPLNPKVPNHVAMRHSPAVMRKIAAISIGGGPMSYRRLHPDRVARTLISGHRAPPAHHSQARSITVREAARLQGFPDDFVVRGGFSHQMSHVTNAVPPPLARAALLALINALECNHE